MKVYKIREAYYEATGTVSTIARQLGFAGIAVIWILKGGTNSSGISVPSELLVSLYYFVLSLSLDFIQYIYKSVVWGFLNRHHWRKHKDEEADVDVSPIFNWPTNIFFWGKLFLLGCGYLELLVFIQGKL